MLEDRDRPLNDRGKRNAPKMAKRLAKRDLRPDLMLSSPARRALATAEIFAGKLDYPVNKIVVRDRLYDAGADDLLDVISELDDQFQTVMLFGHNPELAELAHQYSSEITRMPTCAVVELQFGEKSWSDLDGAKPSKVDFDYPKKQKDGASG